MTAPSEVGCDADIGASVAVAAPSEAVFEFLADLENHWSLADRFIEVVSLDNAPDGRAYGGRVRMRGPLGVQRTALTRVIAAEAPHLMVGTADLGPRTRAVVRWKLSGRGGGSVVRLEATVEQTGAVDRLLLLLLGGRGWLKQRFGDVLQRLAERFPSGVTEGGVTARIGPDRDQR